MEDLLNRLALIDEFKVISRTSSDTYFEKAIAEDPNYALAYAGLADTYYLLSGSTKKNKENKNKEKAVELARKAPGKSRLLRFIRRV